MSPAQEGSEEVRAIRLSHTDEVASILLCLMAIGVFFVSRGFPESPTSAPDPAFFPRVIAGGIALLAVIQFGSALSSDETRVVTVTTRKVRRVVIPLLFLVGYVVLLPVLGFIIATIAFLLLVMYYSGARDVRLTIPIALVAGVILQNLFVGFLHVPLPTGMIPIREWLSLTIVSFWVPL
ncbi:tripartite tricarboxylate transporter TctB family protein [Halococcus salsus]|uniref:tripartite tricarboxylate transporter TctB family protein n=1 Tax=Halococcus salsus TaxID=2162894 RepID=UPI00135B2D79|nr:tripartite tricarboxylate transporter TctB family protein [Halococcus salsus]